MRTTIDLPDELFRKAKSLAAQKGVSLKTLFTHALRKETENPIATAKSAERVTLPLIHSKRTDNPTKLTNADIEDILTIEDLK